MRILTAAGMKAAEDAAVAAGTSYEQLMENAGRESARRTAQLAAEAQLPKIALFLCGRGNNAGDAFVAARLLLAEGWQCHLLPLCGEEYSTLAKRNLLRLPKTAHLLPEGSPLPSAAVIVDGVFGTGFHGGLPPAVHTAFGAAAQMEALRIALDIPSGLNCDTGDVAPGTFQAGHTFTFGAYKPGLLVFGNAGYTGQVECLDIGL